MASYDRETSSAPARQASAPRACEQAQDFGSNSEVMERSEFVTRDEVEDRSEVGSLLRLAALEVGTRYDRQRDALDAFGDAATEEVPPPLVGELFGAMGQAALSEAVDALGGVVAGAVGLPAAKAAVKVAGAAASTAITAGGASLVPSTAIDASGKVSSAVLNRFLEGARRSITDTKDAESGALELERKELEDSGCGLEAATEIRAAMRSAQQEAEGVQLRMLLSHWIRYIGAANARQKADAGKMAGIQELIYGSPPDTTLHLRVRATHPAEPVSVVGAHIETLGPQLAEKLSGFALGDLGIPMRITAEDGSFSLRVDPDGELRDARTTWKGAAFLDDRVSPNPMWGVGEDAGPKCGSYDCREATGAMDGLRDVLEQDIFPRSLVEVGVRLGQHAPVEVNR